MKHKDVLKLLFPVELEGDFEGDIAIEGKQLDDFCARANDLLAEMFPDTTVELIADWERMCEITIDPNDPPPLEARRQKVIAKLRALGGISRQYYIDLAKELGRDIEIIEYNYQFFRTGISKCGDPVYEESELWHWTVKFLNPTEFFYFKAGISRCGEPLLWWRKDAELEDLITDLKPAHTYVDFIYTEG